MDDYRKRDPFFYKYGVHFNILETNYPTVHTHNYWEFFVVLEGSCEHTVNGVKTVLNKNDFHFVRPDDEHSLVGLNKKNSCHLNVMMTDELFRTVSGAFMEGLYDLIKNGEIPLGFTLGEIAISEFLNTIYKIQTLSPDALKNRATLIKSLFFDALKIIYKNHLSNYSHYPKWLNMFLNDIKKPENIGLRVKDICKLTNFSHVHLTRLFKQHVGETLVHYLKNVKLNYAAILLQLSDYKVLDISARVGYASLSHFLREFKATYKLSPTEYRKKL